MEPKDQPAVFDAIATGYDAWFEKSPGKEIFPLELDCVRLVQPKFTGEWLEIGVGTGRFAEILGIGHGIDPAAEMLKLAAARGIEVKQGVGEDLPYADGSMDGAVLVTVLPFLADAKRVFAEAARVVKPGGRFIVSLVPLSSPWGRSYTEQGEAGHEAFANSRFYECAEVLELAEEAGFEHTGDACCLFCGCGETPGPEESARPGIGPGASFVTMGFNKPA